MSIVFCHHNTLQQKVLHLVFESANHNQDTAFLTRFQRGILKRALNTMGLLGMFFVAGLAPVQAQTSGVTAPIAIIPTPSVNVGAPLIYVTPPSGSMIVGQTYNVFWSTRGADTVTYDCSSSGGYVVHNDEAIINGSIQIIAQQSWVDHPSSCTWYATNDIDNSLIKSFTLTTVAAATPAALTLSCGTSTATTAPTAATTTCTVGNSGGTDASGITYNTLANISNNKAVTTCLKNTPNCGSITLTSPGTAGTYTGNLIATPSAGTPSSPAAISMTVKSLAQLTLSCSVGSASTAPAKATTTCTVGNSGQTNATSIIYTSSNAEITTAGGPTSCTALNSNCGSVTISSGTLAKIYNGTITATPAAPGKASLATSVTLTVNPAAGTPASLTLTCPMSTPSIAPTAATTTCIVGNTGGTDASGITYNALTNISNNKAVTVYAKSTLNCGSIILTSPGSVGTYGGSLIATPSVGTPSSPAAISMTVNPAGTPASLTLTCPMSTPSIAPTAATTTCIVGNTGGTDASGITYNALTNISNNKAVTVCAKSTLNCGSIILTSPGSVGTYGGSLIATPSVGTPSSPATINMTVNSAAGTETVTYIHTDGLGSPVAKSNAAGVRITQTKYEPYGMTVAGTATPTIGFTGHVNDADTGLTYMQQRYYDPVAARFLSEDPVLTEPNTGKAFNRYVYANNNPYRYIDPDGRWSPEAHDKLIAHAFTGKLSKAEIKVIQMASRNFDKQTQDPKDSHKHSMAENGESGQSATKRRDDFVDQTLKSGHASASSNDRTAALVKLGEAIHPIMDSSSKEHTKSDGSPKEWNGAVTSTWEGQRHSPTDFIGNETSKNITPEIYKSQDKKINEGQTQKPSATPFAVRCCDDKKLYSFNGSRTCDYFDYAC